MPASFVNPVTARLTIFLLSMLLVVGLAADAGGQRSDNRVIAKTEPRSEKDKKDRQVDDPADAEALNRELWEFARRTPYKRILRYVATAQRESKNNQPAEVELPNGWRIAPAGKQVEVGRLPFETVPFAGKLVVLNTGYYYKEPQEASIVDTDTAAVVKTLKIHSLFPSAVVGLDGELYLSGGFDRKVYRIDRHFNLSREYPVRGFAGGLAPIDSQRLAVGYMAARNNKGAYLNGRLAILNTTNGQIEKEVELGYFPYGVRVVNDKIFVTLLGENKLLIYSRQLELIKSIPVGRTPQGMCSDGRRLYVVNTGSDNLAVINTQSNQFETFIPLAAPESSFGASPTSCAVDSGRLYITVAGNNSVEVLDSRTRKSLAQIRTGWYPTKVLFDERKLIIVSAKGIRPRRPNLNGPRPAPGSKRTEYVLNLLKGSVALLSKGEVEEARDSASGAPVFESAQINPSIKHVFYIIKENRTYDQVLGDLGKGNGDPKLTMFGESVTPIQHQLAREFVTLDNFFVDGEISVLGHSFTTSGYASPFIEWLGNASYSERWKGYPFGLVPATMSPVYLWDLLEDKRVDYRIYGENYFLFARAYRILVETDGADSALARKFYDRTVVAAGGGERGVEFNELAKAYYGRANTPADAYRLLADQAFLNALSNFLTGDESFAQAITRDNALRRRFADYLYHYPFNFRSWELKYSDLDRVRAWKEDFEFQLRTGSVAQLNYIWLPNDHTDGVKSKLLDPYQFVAQNDAALGRVIEIISHSPIWKDSLILVVEDDSQDGPDHVDATRTIAFAAGPYVKRGAVVSDRYDQLSMLRTIELALGLKSLNSAEQLAVPMFGIFTDTPDLKPFQPAEPSKHLAPLDRERYRRLAP